MYPNFIMSAWQQFNMAGCGAFVPQVGSVCQGSSGWVLNRPGSSRTASSRLTKTSRLSSRGPSNSATNKVCVHFNSIIVIWKKKSAENMLWMLYLKWDFWVSVRKICFSHNAGETNADVVFGSQKHTRQKSLWVCACVFAWGRRAGIRQTAIGQ